MCVSLLLYANVSIHHSGSAAKAANGYYWLYMITPTIASWNTVLYIRIEQQNSLAAVDQLVPGAWALQLAFYKKSVLVFDPFHWNGIIIISIIINQNHHNNNNNIKNIQMMDTEVIQNTLR